MDQEDVLDAIVGAALKGMVESGAGRANIGAFAASFRKEVTGILGQHPKEEAPDLLQLVTQAVKEALADPTNAPKRAKAKEPSKRVYVMVNGQRTSLTISGELMDRLDATSGGRRQTKQLLQQLAQAAPQDTLNRSGWVQSRAMATLESRPAITTKH